MVLDFSAFFSPIMKMSSKHGASAFMAIASFGIFIGGFEIGMPPLFDLLALAIMWGGYLGSEVIRTKHKERMAEIAIEKVVSKDLLERPSNAQAVITNLGS